VLCYIVKCFSSGLFFFLLYVRQVINGLMARPDWEHVIKTPIGMLPTGSGNALVASALYESKQVCFYKPNCIRANFQTQ